MRPFALALLLAAAAAASLADERPITSAHLAPSADFQGAPSVACNGGGCFTAWADGRGIYGSPIDPSGNLVISSGINVGGDSGGDSVSVTWDGEAYVVLWVQSFEQIMARRVLPNGTFPDREPAVLVDGFQSGGPVAAASNGRTIVALSQGENPFALIFDRALRPLHSVPLTAFIDAAVASDGDHYLIVERMNSGIVAFAMDESGNAGDTHEVMMAGEPLVIWNGHEYVVAALANGIVARRLDRSGVATGPTVTVAPSVQRHFIGAPFGFAATDGDVAITWSGDNGRLLTTVVQGDSPGEPQPLESGAFLAGAPGLANDGGVLQAVWQFQQQLSSGIDLARIDMNGRRIDGSPADAIERVLTPPMQLSFSAARAPSRAAVWEELTFDRHEIHERFLIEGQPVAEGTAVAPGRGSQFAPAISDDGGFIVWLGYDAAGFALVGMMNGAGNAPFIIAHGLRLYFPIDSDAPSIPAAIVASGHDWLVAYTDPDFRLRVARISRSGVLIDPGTRIAAPQQPGSVQIEPRLATIDGVVLLVWQEGDVPYRLHHRMSAADSGAHSRRSSRCSGSPARSRPVIDDLGGKAVRAESGDRERQPGRARDVGARWRGPGAPGHARRNVRAAGADFPQQRRDERHGCNRE